MNLRESHEYRWSFVFLVVLLALFGLLVARLSFAAGGGWQLLGTLALLGEGLIFYSLFIEPRRLTVKRYREPLLHHPSVWVRIAFLSDLHAGGNYPSDWWERMVLEVQALAPDLIVLGGDYVVDHYEPVAELDPLAKLKAPLGKYFVLGNHDYLDRPQVIRATLKEWGYEDLTHRQVILKHESREFELQGLDDQWFGTVCSFTRSSPTLPHVLISHEPDVLMDLKANDTDVVLSGHTHGGQVRLPGIGALWVPAKLGRAVDAGRKTINGVTGIISNGLGQGKGKPRLFSPPQIMIVEVGI